MGIYKVVVVWFFVLFLLFESGSIFCSGSLGTLYIDQVNLEPAEIHLPLPPELKVCVLQPLVGIYILWAIILDPWMGRSDLLWTKMKKIGTETQIDFGSRILHNFNKR